MDNNLILFIVLIIISVFIYQYVLYLVIALIAYRLLFPKSFQENITIPLETLYRSHFINGIDRVENFENFNCPRCKGKRSRQCQYCPNCAYVHTNQGRYTCIKQKTNK